MSQITDFVKGRTGGGDNTSLLETGAAGTVKTPVITASEDHTCGVSVIEREVCLLSGGQYACRCDGCTLTFKCIFVCGAQFYSIRMTESIKLTHR